jgi:hypothetical protein
MSTNYKPFNLDRALAGDPVVTRNGMKVLNIAYLPDAPDNSKIVCVIDSGHGYTNCITFYQSGMLWSERQHNMDLFMAPIEKEYWVASGTTASGLLFVTHAYDKIPEKMTHIDCMSVSNVQYHKITRLE